jgi:hypothetical protein
VYAAANKGSSGIPTNNALEVFGFGAASAAAAAAAPRARRQIAAASLRLMAPPMIPVLYHPTLREC